jgi:nucleoside phosphorylase
MRLESDALTTLLTKRGKATKYWLDGKRNLHVQLNVQKRTHHLILPSRAYAQNETSAAVDNLVSAYPSIRKLIFVGVGGGVPPARRGDIVISNEVANISIKKLQPGGRTIPKPTFSPASTELVKQAESIRDQMEREPLWWARKRDEDFVLLGYEPGAVVKQTVRDRPEPWVGLIASSNDNVNDAQVRDRWKSRFKREGRRLYAFEMEGSALAERARAEDKQFLIVRGISDVSDGMGSGSLSRAELDLELQPYAARVAAIFLVALIESLPAISEGIGRILTGEHKMYDRGCAVARQENSSKQLLLVQRTSSLILGPEPFGSAPYLFDKRFSEACLRRVKEVLRNPTFRFHYFYSGEKTALKLVDFLNSSEDSIQKRRSILLGVIKNLKYYKRVEANTDSDEGPRFRFDSILSFSGPFAVGDREIAFWLAEKGEAKEKESLVISFDDEVLAKKVFEKYTEHVNPNPSRLEDLVHELNGFLKNPKRGLKKGIVRALKEELKLMEENA